MARLESGGRLCGQIDKLIRPHKFVAVCWGFLLLYSIGDGISSRLLINK